MLLLNCLHGFLRYGWLGEIMLCSTAQLVVRLYTYRPIRWIFRSALSVNLNLHYSLSISKFRSEVVVVTFVSENIGKFQIFSKFMNYPPGMLIFSIIHKTSHLLCAELDFFEVRIVYTNVELQILTISKVFPFNPISHVRWWNPPPQTNITNYVFLFLFFHLTSHNFRWKMMTPGEQSIICIEHQ